MMFTDRWEFPAPPQPAEFFFIQQPYKIQQGIDAEEFTPPSTPPQRCPSSDCNLADARATIVNHRSRPMSENFSDRKLIISMGTDDTDDERYHISRRARFLTHF